MGPRRILEFFALALRFSLVCSQGNAVVSIPVRDTFVLPPTFVSNYSQKFVDTVVPNGTVENLLLQAQNATYITYDAEFSAIIGSSPQIQLLAGPLDAGFAYEAGVYIPGQNLVWFTGAEIDGPGRVVMAINLTDHEVYEPKLTEPVITANGGSYYEGKVYITHFGNRTYAGGVVAIDPLTGETTTLVNSYFGVRLNGPDDVIWAERGENRSLFFTDVDFASALNLTGPPALPNAVWRFDPQAESLQAVIPRSDISKPNGIAVSPDYTKLYITDTPLSGLQGMGPGNTTGSAAVYVYDLDDTLTPVGKRLFSIARTGVPDGIKVDKRGRIWTGEGEGIVVRNDGGKVLGTFNARTLLEDKNSHLANFAFADDRLIVLAVNQIWSIQLAQVVGWTSDS
jgi:gluconolactonase